MLQEWGVIVGEPAPTAPELPDVRRRGLRLSLLHEEFEEYVDAECKNDIVKIADGLADMAYIIWGTAREYGIPLDACIAEVHRSNMTKTIGGVVQRLDGKIMKGKSYEPPNPGRVLYQNSDGGKGEV